MPLQDARATARASVGAADRERHELFAHCGLGPRAEILMMSHTLSDGIINQFPNRFAV